MKSAPVAAPVICAALLLSAGLLLAQEPELAHIKEQELEAVRQQISELKQSMDRRAAERDRITAQLQKAEVSISEKRIELKELERQQQFSERRKAEIDARMQSRQTELERESALLESQVRSAYMTGRQERIK